MPNPKRPRDTNQLAKYIVDLSTGEASEPEPNVKQRAGQLGGLKGGVARAAKLSNKHKSLRCTPAMAAGVVKTLWSIDDMLNAVDEYMPKPPTKRGPYKKRNSK